MTCEECSTLLTLERVEVQVSQVSSEAEVPDKTVVRKEPKEMVGDEYKDNEKVLFHNMSELVMPNREPKKAECFVTEKQIVIETEEPIKIPLSKILECDLSYDFSMGYKSGTAQLTFRDDLNNKHELSLIMANIGDFRQQLSQHSRPLLVKKIETESMRREANEWSVGLIIATISPFIGWIILPLLLGFSWWQSSLAVIISIAVASVIYYGLKTVMGRGKLAITVGIIALVVFYGITVFVTIMIGR
jgi:hypothetical protein